MRSLLHAAVAGLPAASLLLAAGSAAAVDLQDVGGQPMAVDVVNTAAAVYHFDNRNDDPRYAARYLDDHYGEILNRLDAQISWWRLQLGARIDAAFYVGTPSATSLDLLEKIRDEEVLFEPNDARRELHSRYRNTVYPAKLWITYTQPGIEATAGDFYAQLGRGLVFSVRKMDELAIDTTVRGGRLALEHDFTLLRLKATAFAGQLNPLRIDSASGRRLHGSGSPLFFGFPDADSAGDLRTYESTVDPQGNPLPVTNVAEAQPSYVEDTVLGGSLEVAVKGVQLGANGALLRGEIGTFSGSIGVPSIAEHGDVYVEVAGQPGRTEEGERVRPGYAIYAAANARSGPLAVSLEGKHYRRFASLLANIDVDPLNPGFSAPEYKGLAYNQPPTAEPVYVEPIGAPNVCVTGGRGRVDYRFDRSLAVYAWVGHYVSFTEKASESCIEDDANRTDTWDVAAGTELHFDRSRSHVRAWAGARHSDEAEPERAFYSEGYVRYDIVKHLAGAFSVQAQGNNRRRYRPENFESSWVEGDNYLALQWSPHLSAIFGYEYTSQPGCAPGKDGELCHFFSGGLQWKSGSRRTALDQIVDTAQLFVGQRRGGLRCVSGVCRTFPPFEGARLELVSRF
ncbi:hypothetical protein [Sorangium sp. So ce861]|uniref:hypothetical protein n=1 Tax=Sorangium sp. So ce861 TaxID=3133323 RepID=UPI003F5F2305